MAGFTRLDLPLVLGTVVTEDPDRARVAGFFMHLVIGQGFALGYAPTFALLGRASWWLGGLLGVRPRRVSRSPCSCRCSPRVNPNMASERAGRSRPPPSNRPGRSASTTAPETPAVTIVAHLLFGIALGALLHAPDVATPARVRRREPADRGPRDDR